MNRRASGILKGGDRRKIDDGHDLARNVGEAVPGRVENFRRAAQFRAAKFRKEALDGGAAFGGA